MTLAAPELEAYLSRTWGKPVRVEGLARIPGGASRETYRFDALAGDATHRLILRREPTKGLIDTESETEFRAYQSAAGVVPVPRAVALEADGAELGRPFFIMERIDGGEVAGAFTRSPFGEHGEALGQAFFTALGRLAAFDPAGTPLDAHVETPAPENCWRIALDYWEGVIAEDTLLPQPIVAAAIRRLRAAPPPPAQKIAIVHGDYRSGNVMHDGAGAMLAMFDWEMAHLGDPLEDLGWALNPIWDHFAPGVACGMTSRDRAVAAWEAASGLRADAAALDWWVLFNAVKGCGIWTSAWREFVDGGRVDPVLALSGWYTQRRQDQILADLISPLPGREGSGVGGVRAYGEDAAEPNRIASTPPTPSPSLPGRGAELSDVLTGAGLVAAGAAEPAAAVQPFLGATMSIVALLNLLGAQEAEKAAAWRRADIAEMAALLGEASPAIADDATLGALDTIWASLAERLVARHDRIVATGEDETALFDFYRASATRRSLAWPM